MNKNEIVSQVVSKYTKTVMTIAFTYTKNTFDAEDIVQDVFWAFLDESKEFDSEEHIKAWLIRVTINKCKNHMKSRWISKRTTMPDNLSYIPKEQHYLIEAVLSLDKKYRLPIHLFYYEGYSIKEISSILNEKPSTIGSRLERGRKKIKILLGEDNNGQ